MYTAYKPHKPVFIYLLLVVCGVVFFLDQMGGHPLSSLLGLDPVAVFQRNEIWRLFSYPYVSNSVSAFLILVLSIGLLAPPIESTLSTRKFIVVTSIVFLVQGLIHLGLFWQKPNTLLGMECYSFFIMGLFTFMFPTYKIHLYNRFEVRGIHIVVCITTLSFSFWLIPSISNADQFVQSAVSSALGIVLAMLVLLGINHSTIFVPKRNGFVQRLEQATTNQENLEPVVSSSFGVQRYTSTHASFSLEDSFEPEFDSDEERLNFLLDKIGQNGFETLSPEEKLFLKEYSKKI